MKATISNLRVVNRKENFSPRVSHFDMKFKKTHEKP
jgi:hypothetical protein